jgi:hypothetical protein
MGQSLNIPATVTTGVSSYLSSCRRREEEEEEEERR